jgi:hypothetical protein
MNDLLLKRCQKRCQLTVYLLKASVVKHVLAFQLLAKCYQFEKYEPVYDYIKHMSYLDNNDIQEASFQCEE